MIVGKTAPLPDDPTGAAQRFTKKDVSSALRHSESGVVDQVILTTNAEGQRFVKLRARPRSCQLSHQPVASASTTHASPMSAPYHFVTAGPQGTELGQ